MNHQSLSSFTGWVVDLLRGGYKQSKYGRVILATTVSRRLDCVLETTFLVVALRLSCRKWLRDSQHDGLLHLVLGQLNCIFGS